MKADHAELFRSQIGRNVYSKSASSRNICEVERLVSLAESKHEWRCTCCGKLLGVCRDGRMHLRFARGHEYLTCFPVQAICRGCSTLNEANASTR